jgi:hypothetical protein
MVLKERKQPWHASEPNWFFDKKAGWWLQSYLVGIEKIHVGLKDGNNIVRSVKHLSTYDAE